jgi:hypothetical protein
VPLTSTLLTVTGLGPRRCPGPYPQRPGTARSIELARVMAKVTSDVLCPEEENDGLVTRLLGR